MRAHAMLTRAHREEAGFTLIELLIVIAAGGVIIAAIFTMLQVTVRETERTTSKVSATQAGRVATAKLENELRSACLGYEVTPIQAGSDGSDLIFMTLAGSSSSANPANGATPTPVEHKISFAGGQLTDTTYPAASGATGPNWTFSSTASSTAILMSGISQSGSTPVFQYFDYSEPMNGSVPYTDSAGNTYEMIQDGINYLPGSTTIQPDAEPLDSGSSLTASDAASTVEVLVTFTVAPAQSTVTETGISGASSTVQDQIDLRLTPPANHAGSGATFSPCQ